MHSVTSLLTQYVWNLEGQCIRPNHTQECHCLSDDEEEASISSMSQQPEQADLSGSPSRPDQLPSTSTAVQDSDASAPRDAAEASLIASDTIIPGELTEALPATSVLLFQLDDSICEPSPDLTQLCTSTDGPQDALGPQFKVTRLQPRLSKKRGCLTVAYGSVGFPQELHLHTSRPEALKSDIKHTKKQIESTLPQCYEPQYSKKLEALTDQVSKKEAASPKAAEEALKEKFDVLSELVTAHRKTVRPSQRVQLGQWTEQMDKADHEHKTFKAVRESSITASKDELKVRITGHRRFMHKV